LAYARPVPIQSGAASGRNTNPPTSKAREDQCRSLVDVTGGAPAGTLVQVSRLEPNFFQVSDLKKSIQTFTFA
jgi:hypothetical protein